ncbi:MAG: DUF1499 domain-containing protein [Pseudomonadota bacterium]
MIDFQRLTPRARPNTYLVCTPELCPRAGAQQESPVFETPAEAVRDAWFEMIADEPRVRQTEADDASLQYEFVQRTAFLRFPDTITVRFVALDDASSTVIVYSRSRYGYSDMGFNRRRVRDWLDKLEARLG